MMVCGMCTWPYRERSHQWTAEPPCYLSLKAFPMWSFRTVVDFTASVELSPKLFAQRIRSGLR